MSPMAIIAKTVISLVLIPMLLLLCGAADSQRSDAQKIIAANIARPGIIPSEIVRLAQVNPEAVSFCQISEDPDCDPFQLIPCVMPAATFPQPLPNSVNAVFVPGISTVRMPQGTDLIETDLILSEALDGVTNVRLSPQQGFLNLIYRGQSGPIRLYSNAGAFSRVDPLSCEAFINQKLPLTLGAVPAYRSYLFDQQEGDGLQALVIAIDSQEQISLDGPKAGCQGMALQPNCDPAESFQGLPFAAVEFEDDILSQLCVDGPVEFTLFLPEGAQA